MKEKEEEIKCLSEQEIETFLKKVKIELKKLEEKQEYIRYMKETLDKH